MPRPDILFPTEMKLLARTENLDSESSVEIESHNDRIIAAVDGRKYELEITSPEPDTYVLKMDGLVRELFVSAAGDPGKYRVIVRGRQYDIEIVDPRRLPAHPSAQNRAEGSIELRAMMPGKVVRVLTEEGADVKKGDGVLVVEAMKMQNELKSPQDGKVVRIAAKEGATVSAGDLLAVIE